MSDSRESHTTRRTGVREHQHRLKQPTFAKSYHDLSSTDITQLTKVLSHAPKRSNTLQRMYEDQVEKHISKLPSHLRAKVPWISTFCSLHKRLNPPVINSILNTIKREVETRLTTVWNTSNALNMPSEHHQALLINLEDLNGLWLKPELFESTYGRSQASFEYQSNKCSGCLLAHIGGNLEILIAIGASMIGRFKPGIWERSKRIKWMEAWIRDSVEDEEEEDATIRNMWELGSELRRLRKDADMADQETDNENEVNESTRIRIAAPSDVNEVQDNSSGERLTGHPMQSLFSSDTQRRLHGTTAAQSIADSRRHQSGASTRQSRQEYPMISRHTTATDLFDSQDYRPGIETSRSSPHTAIQDVFDTIEHWDEGSLLSQGTTAEDLFNSEPQSVTSVLDSPESELIGPYQHSTVSRANPVRTIQNPSYQNESDTPDMSRSQRQPELSKYPRYQMPPIGIPRSGWRGNVDTPSTSSLRRRRDLENRPALRVGRNGQVKGPFDPVSKESLISHTRTGGHA